MQQMLEVLQQIVFLPERLAERGVRFIQLYHQGWDHHGGLRKGLKNSVKKTDQPAAALVQDLADRGMLDDTLVIWGGEFGRTNYCQDCTGLVLTRPRPPSQMLYIMDGWWWHSPRHQLGKNM